MSSEVSCPDCSSTSTNFNTSSEVDDLDDLFYSQDVETFQFILNEVIVPILFGIITFVGVIGNCLVIYVILSRERMRTVTNLLLLNLAVADLVFVLVIPSVTAYQYATLSWPFGLVACKMMHYVVNVTAYITVYTLVLVSVIRYLTIVHNTSTSRLRTKQNIILLIGAIWIIMLLVNIPILGAYTVKTERIGRPECEHWSMEVAQRVFSTFFVFAYLLPLSIIAVFSICILHHITKHRSLILNTRTRTAEKKRKAGLVLVLVVVVFAILWLPIHLHLLIALFGSVPSSQWYQAISILWNCLAYFNSCVNPIIYNHASKDFRDAFRDVACCGKRPSQHGRRATNGSERIHRESEREGIEELDRNGRTGVTSTSQFVPGFAGQSTTVRSPLPVPNCGPTTETYLSPESIPLCVLKNENFQLDQ